MKEKNKGFTLVELIVSVAILGILIASVGLLMRSGTLNYTNVDGSLSLQYEAQLSMAQMKEHIIDCNGGIAFENGVLTVVNVEDPTEVGGKEVYKKSGHAFCIKNGELYYNKLSPSGNNESISDSAQADKIEDLMSNCAKSIKIIVPTSTDGTIDKITIEIKYEYKDKTYTGTQTIALRNKPLYKESLLTLLGDIDDTLKNS